MVILGLAFGLWEIVFGVAFILAMVLCSSLDRNGAEQPKWWVFIGTLVLVGVYNQYRGNLSFGWLTDAETWKAISVYLLIGLVYSVIEFFISIRKSARKLKDKWSSRSSLTGISDEDAKLKFLKNEVSFIPLISTIEVFEGGEIAPIINRKELAESIGCWTIWWPFYALSLIVGDLLTEIFRVIADFFVSLSSRFVKRSFNNVFKI